MKILIVKTSAIGDVVQTFPVLEYLRLRFPEAVIHWVVEKRCAPLVEAHPYVNAVIPVDTKSWRKVFWNRDAWKKTTAFFRSFRKTEYDLLFDLQGNSKSGLITALARAKEKVGFGYRSAPEKINLLATRKRYDVPAEINVRLRYLKIVQEHFGDKESFLPKGIVLKITKEEEERLEGFMKELPRPVYMVCFGSKWRNKQLDEKTLTLLLQKIAKEKNPYFLFIYGNTEEERLANHLKEIFPSRSTAIGNLSLPLWQALMCRVDLVIAMDSAALHLAGITSTPSFSIFGPSKSNIYMPLGAHHRSFQGTCPYDRTFAHRCPVLRTCPTGACLRDLTPEQLITLETALE